MISPALRTDLYELTMLQAYLEEGLEDEAVFDLFVRRLPVTRNYLLCGGTESVLDEIAKLRFDPAAISHLASLGVFRDRTLRWLEDFRFTGAVSIVREGTPVFAGEPLLEIAAPLPQAQILETLVINHVHLATLLASKAARVVEAAGGRRVVDFGLRRMHGLDTGVHAARTFYIAGVDSTSNVAANQAFGIPVAGTMAHSYVQAHDEEEEAFRRFSALYPNTTLLVDTYDALEGVRRVVRLAREHGERFAVAAVRLDSGDLDTLSRRARAMLDEAGLGPVKIFASGNLDEHAIAKLVGSGAPIDAFGVGTKMGVSEDAPSLDAAYKLVSYAGRGRAKLSPNKLVLPGRKQVFRQEVDGLPRRDVVGEPGEPVPGRPLLELAMQDGRRVMPPRTLEEMRSYARREIARLPAALRNLAPADPAYPVELSPALAAARSRLGR